MTTGSHLIRGGKIIISFSYKIHFAGFLLILLHVSFLFLIPDNFSSPLFQRTWGFHFITYFPLPVILAFYAVALCCVIPPIARRIIALWEDRIWPFLLKINSIGKYKVYGLISILFLMLFYLLRQKYGLLGDSHLRIEQVRAGETLTNSPGAALAYHWIYERLAPYFTGSETDPISMFNVFSGSIYVFLAFLIADLLGENTFQKGIYWSGMMTVGIVQYFFGYIEIYNIMALLIMLFLWTGLLAARDRMNVLIPGLLAVGVFYSHFMMSAILPAYGYLLYRKVLCQ